MRSPRLHLPSLLIENLHTDVFVTSTSAWGQSLSHGFGVHKKLEGRPRLTLCYDLIILPCVEVDIAYPRPYCTTLRFHGDHRAVHKLYHVTDGVHR